MPGGNPPRRERNSSTTELRSALFADLGQNLSAHASDGLNLLALLALLAGWNGAAARFATAVQELPAPDAAVRSAG